MLQKPSWPGPLLIRTLKLGSSFLQISVLCKDKLSSNGNPRAVKNRGQNRDPAKLKLSLQSWPESPRLASDLAAQLDKVKKQYDHLQKLQEEVASSAKTRCLRQ